MQIIINNWKDLVNQFGLIDTQNGCLSARQLSNELKAKVALNGAENYAIPCNDKSDAIALFNLVNNTPKELYYEYTGTAN